MARILRMSYTVRVNLPTRSRARAVWLLVAVVLLVHAGPGSAAQGVTSGSGGGLPAVTPGQRVTAPPARGGANLATTVENVLVTLLADYEYQLGRGVVFQSQGWYPTFALLHSEQDIAIDWAGDKVGGIRVTLIYAKRGLDSGQLLPEQIVFMLPESESWFLATAARRLSESVATLGKGSPPVTWEVLLPELDAEGEMVWRRGLSAAVSATEARGDSQALAARIAEILRAEAKPR